MKTIEALIMRAIPQDKCLHVIAGVIVVALTHLLALTLGLDINPLAGLAAAALVGALKELADHFDGGDPSVYDWLATCAGGLLGLACETQLLWVL